MNGRIQYWAVVLVGVSMTLAACGDNEAVRTGAQAPAIQPAAQVTQAPATKPAAEAEAPLPPSELETQLPPAVRETVLKPFTGDLDGRSSAGSSESVSR